MKRSNKKGFTIVELVIVIAVIAILAAVLIPTFSNVVEKANQSKALQEARNEYTRVLAEDIMDGVQDGKIKGTEDIETEATYTVTSSAGVTTIAFSYTSDNDITVEFDGTDWTYAED